MPVFDIPYQQQANPPKNIPQTDFIPGRSEPGVPDQYSQKMSTQPQMTASVPNTGGGGSWGDTAVPVNRPVVPPAANGMQADKALAGTDLKAGFQTPTSSPVGIPPVPQPAAPITAAGIPHGIPENAMSYVKDGITYYKNNGAWSTQNPNAANAVQPIVNRPNLTGSNPVADYYNNLNRNQPDEEAIRQQEYQRQQARISAINSVYDEELNKAREVGRGRLTAVGAMAANAGTIGSPIQASNENNQQDLNSQNENAINVERNAKIADVFNQIDQTTAAKVAAGKATADKNSADYINFLKGNQQQAQDSLKALAQSGASWDSLSTDQKQKLLDSTGLDQLGAESMYNASKPKAAQVKYDYKELKDGTILRTGDDGTVKEMGKYTPPDTTGNWQLKELADGTLVDYNTMTGVMTQHGAQGQYAKPGTTNEKVVKINGTDYIQNADGSFSTPNVPEQAKQASEIKQQAAQTAQDLLDKFDAGTGTSGVGFGGNVSRFLTGILGGTGVQDFTTQFDALKAQLSLDNVKLLKGQGAVSDAERKLLADASAKLNMNQSEPEFRASLQSIVDALKGPGTQKGSEATPAEINALKAAHPDWTDQYINQQLGFNNDLSTSQNGSIKLGSHLAVANNNPGNIRFVGQPGAVQGTGGFAKFATPEAGVQAMKNLLALRGRQGMTLSGLINSYAPPSENDTATYIRQISQKLGISPSTKVNDINIDELVRAMAIKESNSIIA